jgi:hypothetical protein
MACLDGSPEAAPRHIKASAAMNAYSTASYASGMKRGRKPKKTTPIILP